MVDRGSFHPTLAYSLIERPLLESIAGPSHVCCWEREGREMGTLPFPAAMQVRPSACFLMVRLLSESNQRGGGDPKRILATGMCLIDMTSEVSPTFEIFHVFQDLNILGMTCGFDN